MGLDRAYYLLETREQLLKDARGRLERERDVAMMRSAYWIGMEALYAPESVDRRPGRILEIWRALFFSTP